MEGDERANSAGGSDADENQQRSLDHWRAAC
jgi:hypothetical protein